MARHGRIEAGVGEPDGRVRVGLISDSHIPSAMRTLPEQVFHAFRGVELILHAGDIYSASALDHLEELAPVLAVGDATDQAIGQPRVERRRLVAIHGMHIGMIHKLDLPGIPGDVFPGMIARDMTPSATMDGAMRRVFGRPVQVCVFGDTHHELLEWHEGVLVINPGSPTLPRQMMRLGTVATLEVTSAGVSAELHQLTDFPGALPRYH